MPPSPSVSSRAAHSYAIDELSAENMPTLRSPLPAGYFGDIQISTSKRQEYHEIVRRRVNSMLADEHRCMERRAQQQPLVQETEWKFFRRIGDLKVYQRRLRGRSRHDVAAEEEFPEAAIAVERGNPSMLADGSVAGTIEDMLYGLSATTQGEMMTGLSFTAPPQDAVLLSVVEKSTAEDPLHSAEILWVLTKMPILNPRDVCYLKATGVGKDGKGRPYGYMVLHSVDIPECPPFDYRKTKVLRAKMFFSFLFRETSPGYVDVMGRGVFDLAGGELLKLVLPHATTSVIDGLLRSVSCGEAKRLTLLAMRNREERRKIKMLSKKSVCSMCIRGNKTLLLPGVRLKSCDVCGVPICKNCKIKDKRMFTGIKNPCRAVVCCASCSQQSKEITGVRLGEPEFVVVAEYYSKNHPTLSSSSSGSSAVAVTLSTPSLIEASGQQDPVVRSYEAGKSEPTSFVSDTKSLGVTNSTIGDSCAGFDLDVSFSGTLSERNSVEYMYRPHFNPKDDVEEEPEPVSAELLQEYAELDETGSSGVEAWGGSYRGDPDDFTNPGTYSKRRPNNMLEWMKELQSSAEEAYFTAKANEEIMKKSMR